MNEASIFSYEEFLDEVIKKDAIENSIEFYSPIKRYGGKFYIADKIIDLMPSHYCYVEPFFGAGHVFFKKPKVMVEVINDIDLNIYSFFKVLSEKELFEKFIERVYLLYAHRKIFEEMVKIKKQGTDDIVERAVAFFYVCHVGFNATMDTYSSGKDRSKASSLNNAKRRLFWARDRLKDVFVECKDWKKVVLQHDDKETLIYLDPPYVHNTRKSTNNYTHEMDNEQHEELIDTILTLKSKVILSGYTNEIYEKLEKYGCQRIDIETTCWSINTTQFEGKKDTRVESIWINYKPDNLNRLF
ncbi:MAG TPA: DNA adenine methylase [Thermodesulfovibrio thiophilus]|nr:DNA adenine methylase [Thermodesulfovibrio thiophilus]HQD37001.1 DNA adenine methylase [Thermodesulfovibrio thiophilus]